MKYYSVISRFYDNGYAEAFLGIPKECDCKPEGKMHSGNLANVYVNYFPTKLKANEYIKEVEEA